jgi:chlorophyll synthase
MTLNDFKSVEGDRRTGIGSLPVLLGVDRAARAACLFMALPQVAVVAVLIAWGKPLQAGVVALLLLAQGFLMVKMLRRPRESAPHYNATATTFYVLGMLTAACAVQLAFPPVP